MLHLSFIEIYLKYKNLIYKLIKEMYYKLFYIYIKNLMVLIKD